MPKTSQNHARIIQKTCHKHTKNMPESSKNLKSSARELFRFSIFRHAFFNFDVFQCFRSLYRANHVESLFSMISIIYNHIENDLNIILYHICFWHIQGLMARASWPGPHGQGLIAKGLMVRVSWPRASWPRSHGQGLMAKGLMAKGLMARVSWPGPHGQGPHGQGPHGQGPHGQGAQQLKK